MTYGPVFLRSTAQYKTTKSAWTIEQCTRTTEAMGTMYQENNGLMGPLGLCNVGQLDNGTMGPMDTLSPRIR
jgi:hypothetical protein